MSNNMSIYEAISMGLTIANKREARVSESRVSIDDFAKWVGAEKVAYPAFYDYAQECEKVKVAHTHGEEYAVDKNIKDNAYNAIRGLFACIGLVNEHKLIPNDEVLYDCAQCAVVIVKPLVGEAFKQASIVKNLRDEVNNFATGMNPEYVLAKTKEYETACVKLAVLKKQSNSCETKRERAKFDAFRLALENELARVANKQAMMSREELDARDAKMKAERDAQRKAQKRAKKQSTTK